MRYECLKCLVLIKSDLDDNITYLKKMSLQMNQETKLHWWAFCLPVIAVLIWSMNIAVTRYVVDYISPMSISFYRWFIAFIVLTPFMLMPVWKQRHLITPNIKKLAVLSAFGMFLYQGLSYYASHHTTATNMGIINAFIPIFAIFVSMAILKNIPNRFTVIENLLYFFNILYMKNKKEYSR